MAKHKPRAPKDEGDALEDALRTLDELHAAIVHLANAADLSPDVESELTTAAGNRLPLTLFEVGEADADLPRGYSVALESRLTLSLTQEHAEALAFVLLRSVRAADNDDDVTIELDGRALFDKASARDLAEALDERR
jgi:hypothetical protein